MLKFEQTHVLEFETVARGHHIYKRVWTPVVGEKLHCHHDTRDEAKSHDDYAIGIYKPVDAGLKEKETLVGHLPIELSFLLCKFLENEENCGLSGADLDRFIRFAQTCQSFSQKFFLECIL